MNKIFIILGMCLFLIPLVFASDGGVKYDNTTLWADIYNATTYFNASGANVTVLDSVGNIVVDNQPMSSLENQTGIFRYFFIPVSSGNYYAKVVYLNQGQFLIERGNSLEIRISEDEKVFPIAAMMFLTLIILIFLFTTFWAFSNKNSEIFWFGVLFLGGALFTINIGAFLIMEWSVAASYYSVMRSIFIITSVLSTVYLFIAITPVVLVMLWKFFQKMISGDKQ